MPPGAAAQDPVPGQLGQLRPAVQGQAQGTAAAAHAVPAPAASSLPAAADVAEPIAGGPAEAAAAEVIDLTLDDDDGDDNRADAAAGAPAVPVAAVMIRPPVHAPDAGLHADSQKDALPQPDDAVQRPSLPLGSPGPQPEPAQRCYYSSTATSHGPLAVQRGSTAVLTAQEGHELFVPSSLADASDSDAPSWLPLTLLLEQSGAVKVIPAILRAGIFQQPQGPLLRQYCIPAKGVSELLGLSSKRASLGRLHIRFTARCTLQCAGFDSLSVLQHLHSYAGGLCTYACHSVGTGNKHVPRSAAANHRCRCRTRFALLGYVELVASYNWPRVIYMIRMHMLRMSYICRSQGADKCDLFAARMTGGTWSSSILHERRHSRLMGFQL